MFFHHIYERKQPLSSEERNPGLFLKERISRKNIIGSTAFFEESISFKGGRWGANTENGNAASLFTLSSVWVVQQRGSTEKVSRIHFI